ncbi:MAG: hypothetical protein R3229_00305 [Alphaproteobacteria bacterium]|nr:hypothetical protein [Alphaproteobacteria bacterium]
MYLEPTAASTKTIRKPDPIPPAPDFEPIDLERVVIDPEYRARVRDALNRAHRPRKPGATDA